jgi:hypothetical protein
MSRKRQQQTREKFEREQARRERRARKEAKRALKKVDREPALDEESVQPREPNGDPLQA